VFESWDLAFKPGDRLLIKVDPDAVEGLAQRHGCSYQALSVDDVLKQRVLFSKKIGLVEVLLPPRSSLIGREALPGRLNRDMRIQLLAMQRHGSLMKHSETASGATILREGEVALARASWSAIRGFADRPQELILIGDPKRLARENMALDRYSYTALAILAGMVVLMLTGAVPAVTATLLAAAAMVLSGCLSMEDSYREINWQSVILIASMFPMATAIILVVPIVVATAKTMGVSPYPLLMGTAAAASTALMTPIGTVPNLLVMVPGGYEFKDYIKCGLPLTLLLFAATLVLVPMIWPFYP
jgi:di/tricarboxylate transporter